MTDTEEFEEIYQRCYENIRNGDGLIFFRSHDYLHGNVDHDAADFLAKNFANFELEEHTYILSKPEEETLKSWTKDQNKSQIDRILDVCLNHIIKFCKKNNEIRYEGVLYVLATKEILFKDLIFDPSNFGYFTTIYDVKYIPSDSTELASVLREMKFSSIMYNFLLQYLRIREEGKDELIQILNRYNKQEFVQISIANNLKLITFKQYSDFLLRTNITLEKLISIYLPRDLLKIIWTYLDLDLSPQ